MSVGRSDLGQFHRLFQFATDPGQLQYCHVNECDFRHHFGLDIGYIDHFNTQHVITLNYSAIADFHTLQLTRAQAKYFSSLQCLH
jgi:hypothetical protein